MPKVTVSGKVKHFPYTAKGRAAAKVAKHQGKGTQARLNTAANKVFFGSKASR